LKFVFVDIYFLSLVVTNKSPSTGLGPAPVWGLGLSGNSVVKGCYAFTFF